MNYQQKYLKYKQKYLELKKIIGGNAQTYDALKTSCEVQKTNDPYNNCSNCFYNYNIGIRADGFDQSHRDTQGNIIPDRLKSYRLCNSMIGTIESYFNHALRTNIVCHNDTMPSHNLVLESQRYHNIEDIDQTRLQVFPTDIDTLCAEGNVVWVSANSKVGSTKVDSCIFVIFILNDNSKICIHHVVSDDEESNQQMRGANNITNMMYSGDDAIWNILEGIINGQLQKVYFCGTGINSVQYDKLKKKYNEMLQKFNEDTDYLNTIFISQDKHYLINNDNKLISWN